MADYLAFGGCLRSDLEFPDLSPCPGSDSPDWEIRLSSTEPAETGKIEGAREVEPGWVLELYRVSRGWRLEYGSTGSYEILDGGRQIVWHPGPDRREEVIRAVLLGPVMALALHEAGILCLHGSAIAVEDRGIGFLAPKGRGKSTLAVSLTAAGARLLSDDLVAVTPSTSPEILPGVHSVRMLDDVTRLMSGAFPGSSVRDGWKKTLTNLPGDRLGWKGVPLDSLYLVRPVADPPDGRAVERRRVRPLEAALVLARNPKLTDDLVGTREAGKSLQRIAEITSTTPVYELELTWDLARLSDAVAGILSWHTGAKS